VGAAQGRGPAHPQASSIFGRSMACVFLCRGGAIQRVQGNEREGTGEAHPGAPAPLRKGGPQQLLLPLRPWWRPLPTGELRRCAGPLLGFGPNAKPETRLSKRMIPLPFSRFRATGGLPLPHTELRSPRASTSAGRIGHASTRQHYRHIAARGGATCTRCLHSESSRSLWPGLPFAARLAASQDPERERERKRERERERDSPAGQQWHTHTRDSLAIRHGPSGAGG
jgi:hypothetical protein